MPGTGIAGKAPIMDVVVFGSVNLDILVRCIREPRAGETVVGQSVHFIPGGKGTNQAIAAARLGANTRLVAAVGQDHHGDRMLDFLSSNGVQIEDVDRVEGATGTAIIQVTAGGENSIVVIPGANERAQVADCLRRIGEPVVAVAQFETPRDEIRVLFQHVIEAGGVTILNPSPFSPVDPDLATLCSYLILNRLEFADLIGAAHPPPVAEIPGRLQALPSYPNDVIVTAGSAGFVMRHEGQIYRAGGYSVEVVDSVGGGDCYAGAFAAGLARGASPLEAAYRANAAAALCVTRCGAAPSMPYSNELSAFLGSREEALRGGQDVPPNGGGETCR